MSRKLSVFLSSSLMIGVILLDRQVFAQSPKEITNSIGMKLVLIPKGTFMMGSPKTERDRASGHYQQRPLPWRDGSHARAIREGDGN
jgi:formylglycine-generating enzyme required for sulfatase activity